MSMKSKGAMWALETAYWMNWCNEQDKARAMVIRVAREIIKEDPPGGQRKQKNSRSQQEEAEERVVPTARSGREPWAAEDYLIR